ncbi:TIGR02301 family protein, partial [Hansschlegelia beijingensis]
LIEADAPTPERRDRLAGAFNASFRTWARSYRSCTPAADVAVKRFLQEAGKLASEVRQRYGP